MSAVSPSQCCHRSQGYYHWFVLPARRVAEVPLTEHHPIEGGGELEADHHPSLLTGHVQARDLRHVSWPALSYAPVYAATLAERLDLTQRNLKPEAVIRDVSQESGV